MSTRRTRRNRIRPAWDKDFYVKRGKRDHWHVMSRSSRDVICSKITKLQAKSWLNYNWKAQLELEIEKILLL